MEKELRTALRGYSSEEIAATSMRFFKTGPGDYGEGDRFIGVRVPVLRRLAREFQGVPLSSAVSLLHSEIHEERLLALLLFVGKFKKGTSEDQEAIYHTYLANTRYINNWDLVDTSAEHIVGAYLYTRSRQPLYALARSSSLWERRIAILSTFHFIRRKDFEETLRIAEMLLADTHDLIHKAVGWMLREVGNRDQQVEVGFLNQHATSMPRTMLRYAIEKFPEEIRRRYLKRPAP